MERSVFELEFDDPEEWSTEFYGRMKSQFKLLCQVIMMMMMMMMIEKMMMTDIVLHFINH